MFLRNCVLIFCLALSTTLFAQQETYRLFPTCFSDSSNQFGVRKVGEELYILSTAYDLKSNPVIDQYTNKAYTDLYRVDSCKLKLATLKSALIGEEALLSSPKYDGPLSSDKAMTIIFFSNNNEKLIAEKMGIFYLMKTDNGWSESMPFPLNSEKYNVIHPFYSEETGRLYFASDMAQGKGGFDIYSIEFDGVDFGKIYAEDSINTEFNETFPQYANSRVYFTSDGHGSVGGLDIFFSQAGEIIHLPEPINTIYDDFDLHFIDESTGFLGTNRGYEGAIDQTFFFIKSTLLPSNQLSDKNKELLSTLETKLKLAEEVIDDLISANSNNTLYKALKLSTSTLSLKQDSIAKQLHNYQSSSQVKLFAIRNQVEELILDNQSLDYSEKSLRLNQLSALVDKISQSPSTAQKVQLFNQLSGQVISKLNKRPSSLLSKITSYENDISNLAQLESQQEQMNQEVFGLASIIQQESVKSAIQSPELSQLSAFSGNVGESNLLNQSANKTTTATLNQAAENQRQNDVYQAKLSTLLVEYKKRLVNSILNDSTKTEEEKLTVLTQINTHIAQACSKKFLDENSIKALAYELTQLQKENGFDVSVTADDDVLEMLILSQENNALKEISENIELAPNSLDESNLEVLRLLTTIENNLLEQLVEDDKLSKEYTDRLYLLLQDFNFKLKKISSSQESIRLLEEFKQSLAQLSPSLTIPKELQTELLSLQEYRIDQQQIRLLEKQLISLEKINIDYIVSDDELYVGIVQFNKLPYVSSKVLVIDQQGVIVDSVFTDELGLFSYKKLSNQPFTLEIEKQKPEDDVIFYNLETAENKLKQIQIQSAAEQGTNQQTDQYTFVTAQTKSKEEKVNLSSFKVTKNTTKASHITVNEIVKGSHALSSSFMNILIESYELPLIQFKFDSFHLQRKYNQQLDELVKFLSDYDQFAIKVIGHTDITGDVKYNLLLSEKRAKYVKHYLVRKGLSDASFVVEGVGPRLPISTNDTKEGRKLNRRVEIRLEVK